MEDENKPTEIGGKVINKEKFYSVTWPKSGEVEIMNEQELANKCYEPWLVMREGMYMTTDFKSFMYDMEKIFKLKALPSNFKKGEEGIEDV